jgi:hypothetical protein
MPDLIACHTALGQQYDVMLSSRFGTVAVAGEWSIVLAMHYSRTVVVCLYALQALTVLPVRTYCSSMMALMSGALETCARALGTCIPSCTGRHARLFFMLEAHGP